MGNGAIIGGWDRIFDEVSDISSKEENLDNYFTMKYNTRCTEMSNVLLDNQMAWNWPDIIVRVVKMKMKIPLERLIEENEIGRVAAPVFVTKI